MKKKQLLSGVMALLLSASLCACGGSKTAEGTSEAAGESSEAETSNTLSEGTPVPGGSVVYGMTQDLASLDPHVDTDAGTRDVVFNLYEGLVKPTSDGGFIPAVASDYTISDDAKTYTFTLRDGITFHDGTPVTIEDVKYSIDRYAEIQGESSAFSSLVDSVEVQDDKTLVVNLKESYSEFLPMMTIAIIPQSNEDPAGNPIGTGPFKYVSYTPGQNLELEKYDGYWQEGVPSLDSVEFKFIADVDTAFVELQAGTIDILKYLTAAQAETLGDDYNIVQGSMNLVHAMYLNSAYEPLSKTEVRQALCYAVDRDAINNFIFGGKSHIIGSHMIPAMSKYYEPEAETVYSYDPEKAKELLAEFKQKGYPMILATSGDKDCIRQACERLEIRQYFTELLFCSEVGAGKDRPDIYLEAARKMNCRPDEALVVEDALHAIETAKKAGFSTAAVYDKANKEQEKIRETADIYLKSFDEQLTEMITGRM